jgi:hypothetical protein
VKTRFGKPIAMDVQDTNTICGMWYKDTILENRGIPHNEQHIVFSDKKFDDYNIQKTLVLTYDETNHI